MGKFMYTRDGEYPYRAIYTDLKRYAKQSVIEDILMDSSLDERLEYELKRLTPYEEEALRMTYFEVLNLTEMAYRLNLSVSHVGKCRVDAFRKLTRSRVMRRIDCIDGHDAVMNVKDDINNLNIDNSKILALKRGGFITIEDVMNATDNELKGCRWVSTRTIKDVRRAIECNDSI